jgi:AraC family transcriptional regulator, transcriptional activator of pobA
VWNRGAAQRLYLDDLELEMPPNTIFALNVSHSFRLERSEEAVIWQFNREFYCIVTHDAELGCSGLLFYGWHELDPIYLDEACTRSLGLLVDVFEDEFGNRDNIQGEMLLVLLKRLIIKLTRLIRLQSPEGRLSAGDLDLVRQYNLLVENHYRQYHQVQDYARLMFKAPKSLSNLFAKYSQKSPLEVINERLFIESKRLLLYTDKPASDIAFELGFEEPAHFSRFFKRMSGIRPTDFRKNRAGRVLTGGVE